MNKKSFIKCLPFLITLFAFVSCTSSKTAKKSVDLQNLVEKTLGDRIGAIVVMKASTNEIIASASNGSDENSLYPAGSLSYLPVLSVLLEDKNFDRDRLVNCNGSTEINGIKVVCHKTDGHGDLSLKQAFADTCDVYFSQAMQNCDSKKLLESERKFNFEIIDNTWLSKPYQAVQTSPMKMAQMMSALCKDKSPLATELKEFLRYRATDGSIKSPMKNDSVKIAGTAATSDPEYTFIKNRWNSLGVSYAPYDAPLDEQIVVSVLVDANNEWEWWAPYAMNIIIQGYFFNQDYDEASKNLGFSYLNRN